MALEANIFSIDKHHLRQLKMFYLRMPAAFTRATGKMLNNVAAGMRNTAIESIILGTIARNRRFIMHSIAFSKTPEHIPIKYQEVEIGSIARQRFTGWREPELGTAAERTRIFMLLSRGGSKTSEVDPTARLLKSNVFPTPDDFPLKRQGKRRWRSRRAASSPHRRAFIMLKALDRQGYQNPFIIYGHDNLPDGVYAFRAGPRGDRRINLLQRFKTTLRPRRFQWMRRSYQLYFARINLVKEWGYVIERTLKIK